MQSFPPSVGPGELRSSSVCLWRREARQSVERPVFLFCLCRTWMTPPVRFVGGPDLGRLLLAEDVPPPPTGVTLKGSQFSIRPTL